MTILALGQPVSPQQQQQQLERYRRFGVGLRSAPRTHLNHRLEAVANRFFRLFSGGVLESNAIADSGTLPVWCYEAELRA